METISQAHLDEEVRQLELEFEYRAGVPEAREEVRRQQEKRLGIRLKDPIDTEGVDPVGLCEDVSFCV